MRPGVRIALDLGTRRIGAARCDGEAILAFPLATIDATSPDWRERVQSLVSEYGAMEVIIGHPVTLRGTDELAALAVRDRAASLAEVVADVPIRLVDERLTTATAHRQLREAGHDSRSSRAAVDAAAAVGILDFALEFERRTGNPPGEVL